MSNIRARFRLQETKRIARFRAKSDWQHIKSDEWSGTFDQTGWGTTVKLQQIAEEGATPAGSLTLVLNEAEAKVFGDAPIGAEFDIVVSPVKGE